MHGLLLLLALAAYKPSFEKKYFDSCYENEDADTCTRRQTRWKESMDKYRAELAEERDRELGYLKKDAAELEVKPEDGAEKVGPLAPKWCKGATEEPEGGVEGLRKIARNIKSFNEGRYFSFSAALYAADAMCIAPDNDDVKKLAGALIQSLVNSVGYSSEEAIADLTARLDEEGLKKSKKALCAELGVDEEALGAEKTFGETRRTFFGCSPSTDDKVESAQWTSGGGQFGFTKIFWYLDTDVQPASELVRLAYLLDTVRPPADDSSYKAPVAAQYAWLQLDMKAFDPERLKKEMAEPPFKDNVYARLTLSESVAQYQRNARAFEAFVKKTAKDDDWKNIITRAPEKAVKEWTADFAKYKDAVQDARDFEGKLFAPSLKAGKGCSAKLRPAFAKYLKSIKAKPAEFDTAVAGDAVGSYLLQHLVACEEVEGNAGFAALLRRVSEKGRLARGPRLAAYYGAVEAVGTAKADRPKFPIEPNQLWSPAARDIEERAGEASKEQVTLADDGASIVKSVSKTPKGTKVVFITQTYQYMSQTCTPTNRIYRINSSGVVEYYSNCKDAGLKTGSEHVKDIVVPNEFAAGIAPGRYVEFTGDFGGPNAAHYPIFVYADKSKSKLVNWRGFGL